MWKLAVAALALFVMASTAHAAAGLDRMVAVDDPRIAEALRAAVGQPAVSEAVARRIGPLMYEDNRLTRNESDLFLELLGAETSLIEIAPPMGEPFRVPPLSAGARAFLALSDPPDLETLWLMGAAPMKQLADVTVLNPHVRGQVQHYIANNLYAAWRSSSAINNYGPLRDTLRAIHGQWQLSGAETLAVGRGLLYNAMVELDMAVHGAVPDDLYTGLKT